MNDRISSFTLLLIIVAVAAPRPVDAELPPAPCDSLIRLSLPQTTVDSAVIITAGDFVAPPFGGPPREADAVEKLYGSLPAFCRVVAHARPTPESEIRIEVWLPLESWNGEFRGTGMGGFAGAVNHLSLAGGVKRGFAVAGTNTGHEASPVDARWALGHPEKVVDFGWRAIHEMTTTAKAVVEAFYGRPPRYSYFSGCSNGGRQALMEAQRFPGDYDGIVAGAPAAAWSRLMVKSVWNAQALTRDSAAWIPPGKVEMLARAVNEACDAHDGIADGILADPRDCDFDPETLLCEEVDEDDCLTPPQVAALEAIYRGPHRSDGTTIYPGIPPGAEGGPGGWINWITGPEPRRTGSVFSRGYYRNMVFGDPDWFYRTADIDQLLEAGRAATGEELDATDPDLGPFARRGGRLILYHGWNDPAISAHATVDYYEAVEQTVGEDETEGFVRLYMVPGVQHCGGGPGPQNFHGALDRAVERWVRTGDAPSRIETDRTADDGAGDPVSSWPLCPYPQRAVYTGGDPSEPSNFECRDEDAGSTDEDADTVHVAPPAGETETDRASILATLAQAGPGDVIQFAPGTYLVGEIIPIETAELTILGHGDGTTLRGCDPGDYERMERETEAAGDDQWARMTVRNTCGVFEMTGGHGTIRGLTFEYTWVGLALGAGHSDSLDFHVDRVTDGGYLVEDNAFRNSANGIRPGYLSGAPTVIRGNRFRNLGHAVSAAGAGIHVLDNDISVPDPEHPLSPQGPLFAIGIGPAQECVVEGNRIEGHPSGIVMFGAPGSATRGNVIRDNTITVRGAGLPLGLWGGQEDGDGIEIEDNLIERNRIMGAVGAGIALNRASRNRILGNTITGITLGDPSSFGAANGSGIWVSPGSDGNEIVGNTFEDIAAHDIVLEGDRNVIETRSATDSVRDLGTGNHVSRAGASGG